MSTNNGSLMRGIRGRLKATLKGKSLERALKALSVPKKLMRLPKDVSQKTAKMAQDTGSATVIWNSHSGKWRVFSAAGHKCLSDSARKHQPWKHKNGKKQGAAPAEAGKK